MKRKIIAPVLALGLLATLAATAHAAGGGNFGLDTAAGGTGIATGGSVPGLIGNILKVALGFVGTLFLLLMVYAGFIYMTARGDEKKVKSAKDMIVGAVIGVVIIAAAYAVTSTVLTVVKGGTPPTASDTKIPPKSVSTGGACTADADCSQETDACVGGVCASQIEIECSAADPCPATDGTTCQDIDPSTGKGVCK